MRNKSSISPIHKKWHRRVEGQIRCCMTEHPEYFNMPTERVRQAIINSLAKRIVGEIAADRHFGAIQEKDGVRLSTPDESSVARDALDIKRGVARLPRLFKILLEEKNV